MPARATPRIWWSRSGRRSIRTAPSASADIVDQGRAGSDPLFRAAAESARRTFFNPHCTPLKLPPEKYATWKDLVVDFSPKDIQ